VVEAGYQNVTPPDGVTKSDLVARYLAVQVAKFYENYYASLAAPLTLEAIGIYIEQTYPSSTSANQAAYKELLQRYYLSSGQVSRTDSTFTELDSNADDALSRGEFNQYIANQPAGGGGTGGTGAAGGGAGSTISSEFERSILAFRTALVNYKLTGNPGFKTQANTWKEWIDKQIQEMKDGVAENTQYVQDFLTQYETSDQDLRSLQSGLRTIRQTGPEVQAQYETEKKAQQQEPLDFSQFYTKSGTLLGILAVVAGASLFL
jgi:Ca2+-binding EF-hand superfamily protein